MPQAVFLMHPKGARVLLMPLISLGASKNESEHGCGFFDAPKNFCVAMCDRAFAGDLDFFWQRLRAHINWTHLFTYTFTPTQFI